MNEVEEYNNFLNCLIIDSLPGIDYWADVKEWEWSGNPDDPEFKNFRLVIKDFVDEDGQTFIIDKAALERGLEFVKNGNSGVHWSSPVTDPIWEWDYDAGDADCVIQLACFHEVIYG